jgi:hypothetical protein
MEAVEIQYYFNRAEAELARNLLHEEKVWSMVRMGNSHGYSAAGGATLVVKPEDVEKAKVILGIE